MSTTIASLLGLDLYTRDLETIHQAKDQSLLKLAAWIVATKVCIDHLPFQGSQIFSIDYGQNLNKKRLFFEGIMLKNAKMFSLWLVIYIIIKDSQGLESSIFFPKKSGFAKEASFNPKTAILAMNFKLLVTTSLSLS